jgi:hypothetical protein
MKDFVRQENMQTRDELVTSVMNGVAVIHKSYKRVKVNVMCSNEVAFAKPMIGGNLGKPSPKYVERALCGNIG